MWARFADRGLNLIGELVEIVAPLPDEDGDDIGVGCGDGGDGINEEYEGMNPDEKRDDFFNEVEVEPRGRNGRGGNKNTERRKDCSQDAERAISVGLSLIDTTGGGSVLTDIELESPNNYLSYSKDPSPISDDVGRADPPTRHECKSDVNVDMLSKELKDSKEDKESRVLKGMFTEKEVHIDTSFPVLQEALKEKELSLSVARKELEVSRKKLVEITEENLYLHASLNALKVECIAWKGSKQDNISENHKLVAEMVEMRNPTIEINYEQMLVPSIDNQDGFIPLSAISQIEMEKSQIEVEVTVLKTECERLKSALLESETLIKENEELTWHAKAEASELLFALEIERGKVKKLESKPSQNGCNTVESKNIHDKCTALQILLDEMTERSNADKVAMENLQSKLNQELEEKFERTLETNKLKEELNSLQINWRQSEERAIEVSRILFENERELQSLRDTISELELSKEEVEKRAEAFQKEMKTLTSNAALHENKASESNGIVEGLQQQVVSLKQQLHKAETESKQLHQVILQLRSVRRNNKEDLDGITTERDELKAKVQTLFQDLVNLKENLKNKTALVNDTQTLKSEHAHAISELKARSQSLEEALIQLASLEKECYDKDAALEALKADNLLTQQDLNIRTIELENLHAAIQQMQREKEVAIRRIHQDFECRLDKAREEERAMLLTKDALWREKEAEFNSLRISMEQKCTDQSLLRRKAEIDFNAEKRRMQKTLEGALIQLRNATSNDDVVDRQLIANLIVSYLKRRRSVFIITHKRSPPFIYLFAAH